MLVLRNPCYRTRTYTLYKSVTMRKKSSSFRRKTKVNSPRINSANRGSAICGQLKFVKSSGPSVEMAICGFAIFKTKKFFGDQIKKLSFIVPVWNGHRKARKPVPTHHTCHKGESATMVQVEVGNDDTVQVFRKILV
jgi:hypothetical protein